MVFSEYVPNGFWLQMATLRGGGGGGDKGGLVVVGGGGGLFFGGVDTLSAFLPTVYHCFKIVSSMI